MPRKPRELCDSGIYHVMIRGVNRQDIFSSRDDYEYFLNLLIRVKELSGFELYAYCLMSNHVHLLIREKREPLEHILRRLNTAYATFFNWKYDRVGHLFQNRFKSEPVKDDDYLLTVFRYILRNPLKAGLCETPEQYEYSSMREYISGRGGLTDIGLILSMRDRDSLLKNVRQEGWEKCMDMEDFSRRRLTDAEAAVIIGEEYVKNGIGNNIENANDTRKSRCVHAIHNRGVSIRQLCSLTNLTKFQIESILKKDINAAKE